MNISETPNPSRDIRTEQMVVGSQPEIIEMVQIGNSIPDKISNPEIRAFTLRVNGNVIDQVNEAVSKHPVIRNRNTWIVNAIVEQLKRER